MELRRINNEDAKAQWEYTTALPEDENGLTNPYNGVSYDEYIEKVLPTLISYEHPVNMPDWFVPETYYYLWDEEKLVGEFRIRHHLTEALRNGAGHIGYSVKRDERGKGYGTAGLKLTIAEAKKIVPEDEIYLRVNKDNIASQKVMLNNGAYRAGEDEDHYFMRIKKVLEEWMTTSDKHNNEMIKRFKEVNGLYIEKIYGQDRLAFAMSDTSDLYDLIEFAERGGYQGSVIKFYDFENGNVYTPFEKKRDVIYSKPAYTDCYYYFLQADYGLKKVTLYKYFPEKVPGKVTEFSLDEVDLYNLQIVGESVHVISQNAESFRCYYPEKISFALKPNETVELVTDDKVVLEAWIEEGWDEERECATDDYKYYDKVIVKDFEGNTISEEVGSIYRAADGTYWMA